MLFSQSAIANYPEETIVACTPNTHPNYTGIASFIEAPGWRVPDTTENRRMLEGACLFPISMVREAAYSGSMSLPGGDWGVYGIPDGVETCAEYYSFQMEVYGEHPQDG